MGAWLPAVSSTVRLHLFRDVVNRFAVREAQMHDFEANITFYDLTNPVYSNVTLTGSFFYSAGRLYLFTWCVRLSRLLVGFRTQFKSLHFHFIHSFIHSLSSGREENGGLL